MGYTNFPNGITSFGVPIYGGGTPQGIPSGSVYFVDNNSGNDSKKNAGESFDNPLKNLVTAISDSNTNIARGPDRWARRNTIYYCADTETVDLVAFPNKCDVIGVGSYDANSKPGITGNHVPVNSGNYGTRFFNVWFKAPSDASPIVTLASTSSGCQFVDCTFSATATTTIGIQATASPFLKVIGCRFEGAFVTSYLTFGTGEAGGTEILNNVMVDAAAKGIITGSGTTSSWAMIVRGNYIEATTIIIDDDGDELWISRNDLITAATVTSSPTFAEAMDVDATRIAGNWLTAANVATHYPVIDTTT
jgi:hypothetical protein